MIPDDFQGWIEVLDPDERETLPVEGQVISLHPGQELTITGLVRVAVVKGDAVIHVQPISFAADRPNVQFTKRSWFARWFRW